MMTMGMFKPSATGGYPIIQSSSSYISSSSTTSHTMNYPSGITTGDMIMVFTVVTGSLGFTNTAFLTYTLPGYIASSSNNVRLFNAFRRIDGTEGSTFSWTLSSAGHCIALALRISNYYWAGSFGSSNVTNFQTNDSVYASTVSNPDPANHSPSWGAANNLFFTFNANAGKSIGFTVPSGYSDYTYTVTHSTLANQSLGVGVKQSLLGTENPGAWSLSGTRGEGVMSTIAIRGN